ncbi:MAG: nucleotidyltransferase [Saprospiraceae bacterium]|nr:nucleotidyltransferase [Saprospiraceae bacterium]
MTVKKPSLLVLAAGMGSRYGGLKQLDSFGPNGETIIDYSIFDAIEVGFEKIVFVIRKSFAIDFINRMENRWRNKIEMDFVYQELDILPMGFSCPVQRTKPWGTGHAVWVAKEAIKGPFGVINADDFYGRDAMHVLYNYLNQENNYAVVAYSLQNTLSDYGAVNRGVCEINQQGYLSKVIECKNIIRDEVIYYLQDEAKHILRPDTLVSMNMWGFQNSYFNWAEHFFIEFLRKHQNTENSEFYIPELIQFQIDHNNLKVNVLHSNSNWIGVTYKEDKEMVAIAFNKLIEAGMYPFKL